MLHIKKYTWALLIICCHPSHAQTGTAQTGTAQSKFAPASNDSVFKSSVLSGASLFDVRTRKMGRLPASSSGAVRLFVFLSPECPLCQNYTRTLNALNRQYAGKVEFYGIIPGKTYTPEAIAAFAEKYKISYPLLVDGSLRLSRYLQASVTPEAILLNQENQLLYKGAIDNWVKELGKQRIKATENYLQDAMELSLQHKAPAMKRTGAVGCLINDF
jgi:thiol-disulfide isomerase/thioredoxin